MSELDAAVERVWPGRDARVEVLGGGITNHNLKVEVDGERFVLRVAGRDTALLGIDREVELEATRAAAAAGIGPEVVAFVEPEGWLVTRFLDGEMPPLERMGEPELLRRVAQALRAFHDGPPIRGTFDSFRIVETYRQTALDRGGAVPPAFVWAQAVAARIEEERGGDPVPCHNDLLNANFLDDGEHLWIVDWEYAGMGDRFFDLANFSINHELDCDARRELLEAYFGEVAARGRARARADALHVGLPRGDVGGGAVGRLGARLRLPRLRDGAFRAARADRSHPGVRRGARAVDERGATRGTPRSSIVSVGHASVGSPKSARRSSSSRSSSSSVPMRTGPLNQFFADSAHQPPKTMPKPANQSTV